MTLFHKEISVCYVYSRGRNSFAFPISLSASSLEREVIKSEEYYCDIVGLVVCFLLIRLFLCGLQCL